MIPPRCEEPIGEFSDGLAKVGNPDKPGYVEKTGKIVVRYGYIDKTGNMVIKAELDHHPESIDT